MSKVVLLGAGSSRGTLGPKAPTAEEFGAYLNLTVPTWTTDYPYLYAAVQFLTTRIPTTSVQSWALDKVWGAIDNRVKLRYILDPDLRLPGVPVTPPSTKTIYRTTLDPIGIAGIDLRSVLSRIYGKELESEIETATKRNDSLKAELKQLTDTDCLVSFNYDLLAERMLDALGKCYVTASPWSILSDNCKSTLLCKPHGSLNWKTRVPEKGGGTEILSQSVDEKEIDFHVELGLTIQPGIIAPVPFKEQLAIPELQQNVPDFFGLLVAQWKGVIERVSRANSLVFMGYRFPKEDLHAQYILGEAAARRNTKEKLEINVYLREQKSYEKLKETLEGIFHNAKIQCKGPVTPYT